MNVEGMREIEKSKLDNNGCRQDPLTDTKISR